MAECERNYLRPDAVEFDVDGRHGIGCRKICVDHLGYIAGSGHTTRVHDLHADGHDRLQHGNEYSHADGEQGDADGKRMANRERNHLWSNAEQFDLEWRDGIGWRKLCVDHIDYIAGSRHTIRVHDLHADGHDRLQHGNEYSHADGEQGDSDHLDLEPTRERDLRRQFHAELQLHRRRHRVGNLELDQRLHGD